jgi:hypothetical protein
LFFGNGLSYAVGGPSIGIAVQAADMTNQTVPPGGGLIDPPDDSGAPPVQPASSEWMTNILWNDQYRSFSDAFGGTGGYEHCRQIGSTMLCVRLRTNIRGEASVFDLWNQRSQMMLLEMAAETSGELKWYPGYTGEYWGIENYRSEIVTWQMPISEYYLTDPSCGGKCSYLPPVPASGPSWSRYEFWRVMVEELKGEIAPYAFYQAAAARVATPMIPTQPTCDSHGGQCPAVVNAINSAAQAVVTQYPTWNDYKITALVDQENTIHGTGYGATVTYTDGPEGVGGNVILTENVLTKDTAIASCDGIYLPYTLGLGCAKATRSYQTTIRASEGSHTVQTYGGGTAQSPDYTGAGASTVLWTVGTDPVGAGSEVMIVNGYLPSKKVVRVGGTYIGSIPCEPSEFDEGGLLSCNPSLYEGWHFEVRDSGYAPIGESFVYDVSIQRYWLTHTCSYDGGCSDTIRPFTPAEWSHITIYMNALSLIDKMIFVSWFNTHAGSCATESDNMPLGYCWTSDTLNIEEFDKYAKNGDLSIFDERAKGYGNLISGGGSRYIGRHFEGAFLVCQLLSLKSVATQRRLYAVGPMVWDPENCERGNEGNEGFCKGLSKCHLASQGAESKKGSYEFQGLYAGQYLGPGNLRSWYNTIGPGATVVDASGKVVSYGASTLQNLIEYGCTANNLQCAAYGYNVAKWYLDYKCSGGKCWLGEGSYECPVAGACTYDKYGTWISSKALAKDPLVAEALARQGLSMEQLYYVTYLTRQGWVVGSDGITVSPPTGTDFSAAYITAMKAQAANWAAEMAAKGYDKIPSQEQMVADCMASGKGSRAECENHARAWAQAMYENPQIIPATVASKDYKVPDEVRYDAYMAEQKAHMDAINKLFEAKCGKNYKDTGCSLALLGSSSYTRYGLVLSMVGGELAYRYTEFIHVQFDFEGKRYYAVCLGDLCRVYDVKSGLEYSLLPLTDAINDRYYLDLRLAPPTMLMPWFGVGAELYMADFWVVELVIGIALLAFGLWQYRRSHHVNAAKQSRWR